MSVTAYHAKYFAHELTRRAPGGIDRLSMSLFNDRVDLNPYQIEAALFALKSPLSKVVLLADEVGLCKTIEADIQRANKIIRKFLAAGRFHPNRVNAPTSSKSKHGFRSFSAREV